MYGATNIESGPGKQLHAFGGSYKFIYLIRAILMNPKGYKIKIYTF